MDIIKEMAGLPFKLKGVQTAEDAELACSTGWMSSGCPNAVAARSTMWLGSMDTLPEIARW